MVCSKSRVKPLKYLICHYVFVGFNIDMSLIICWAL